MAKIKFLKGLLADLPTNKVEGQVYFATDEPAIYFDESSTSRVKMTDSSSSEAVEIIEEGSKTKAELVNLFVTNQPEKIYYFKENPSEKISLIVKAEYKGITLLLYTLDLLNFLTLRYTIAEDNGLVLTVTNTDALSHKQDTLVSGTNIKTINNQSLLGSGNIDISGGSGSSDVFIATYNVTPIQDIYDAWDSGKVIYYINPDGSKMLVTHMQNHYDGEIYSYWMEGIGQRDDGDSTSFVNFRQLFDNNGASFTWGNYAEGLIAGRADLPAIATDTIPGIIKLNPSESITLNSDNQLDVGGRLGQMSNTTGIYSPKTINPQSIGNGSFLLTEGSGQILGSKSLAVVTGSGLSLKTAAAAGATTYTVSNTYENRIICAGIVGGVLALNEATAAENYVNITSVTSNGYAPASANYWTSTADIIIKTGASINPTRSTSSVRPYCTSTGFSNLCVGQQSGSNGGASIVVGQKTYSASGNACAIVGASMYNTGNGNALFGRQHISRKNRSFLAGTGHDTTNGPAEGIAALGTWSDIKSTTSFAIGNGTDSNNRSNSFEINTAGDTFLNGYLVLKSPNGTQYKISVDNSGTLITSAL